MSVTLYASTFGWHDQAACKDSPVDFFPHRGQNSVVQKSICGGCPVIDPCLTYSLSEYTMGIWGGTTERDRRTLRRST